MPSISGILMSVMTRSGRVLAALLDQLSTCACDGHHEMPEAGQDRLQIVPHVELVVGHGDPEVTVHELASLLPGQGQDDLGSPCPGLADPDAAAVGLDDSLDDGHTQAGPAGLRSIERFEDLVVLLGGQAGTVVPDGEADRRRGRRAWRQSP